MKPRRALGLAVELLVVVAVVALLAGQVLGQPVLLGYVETGSMAPTMAPGDGFVAVPAALAGPIAEGDVVTFRAEELHGGGLTTHRVVGETERGFITRGDANPFTDQDGDEPPVQEPQIVAVAWSVNGEVVVIPNLGTGVAAVQGALSETQRMLAVAVGARSLLGTQGIAYLLLGLSAVAYVADVLFGDDGGPEREREHDRENGWDARYLLAALALVVVVAATAAMVVPGGTQQFGVVSAESDAPGPRVIESGTSESFTYGVGNGGLLPVRSYLVSASEGVTVEPDVVHVEGRSVTNATVTLSAPPETGYYRRFLVEHRYLAVLPDAVLDALHAVHPWAPIAVIDSLLGASFYLLGRALVGEGRIRRRERPGGSVLGRLFG